MITARPASPGRGPPSNQPARPSGGTLDLALAGTDGVDDGLDAGVGDGDPLGRRRADSALDPLERDLLDAGAAALGEDRAQRVGRAAPERARGLGLAHERGGRAVAAHGGIVPLAAEGQHQCARRQRRDEHRGDQARPGSATGAACEWPQARGSRRAARVYATPPSVPAASAARSAASQGGRRRRAHRDPWPGRPRVRPRRPAPPRSARARRRCRPRRRSMRCPPRSSRRPARSRRRRCRAAGHDRRRSRAPRSSNRRPRPGEQAAERLVAHLEVRLRELGGAVRAAHPGAAGRGVARLVGEEHDLAGLVGLGDHGVAGAVGEGLGGAGRLLASDGRA